MKKRILSLVLCAALLLSLCLFMGAGATDDTYKVTVNYIYESDSSPVAQATVLQVAKDEALNKKIMVPTQLNYTPKLAGDTPDGITLDPATGMLTFADFKPTGNVTVKVLYVAGNAKYTVNHYLQNLDNDEYTLGKSVELTGSIDAYTAAVADLYPGFTAGEVQQSTIAADGTTVVSIYYKRNYYMVQFSANGGVNGPEPIYAKYGTTYDLPGGPTKEGYRFAGWFDSEGRQVTEGIVKANVTYTAGWTPISDKAGVTVVYWGQNANDDEYSYYGAAVLTDQNVGGSLAWNDVKNLTAYTCGLEEHTHTADCGITCVHTGSHAFALSCVGLDGAASVDPNQYGDGDARTHFEDSCKKKDDCKKAKLKEHLKNGSVCQYKDGEGIFGTDYYYFLYFDGVYYKISSELYNQLKSNTGAQVTHGRDTYYVYEWNGQCLHNHTDACYDCGKITHTHTDSCRSALNAKMDSSLWTYEKSDTVTVDAAGNTIMNVYYTRKVFTLHFREKNSSNDDYGTIQARWGKDIAAKYNEVVKKAGSSFWSERKDAKDPWTNYIGVMPQTDKTYYRYLPRGSSTSTMTYYGEDLSGNDQVIFTISFNGSYNVTAEDRYEFEGFTYHHGTSIGDSCDGAKFYYKRNTYSLNFYSASSSRSDKTANVKFQAPLGSYDYTPTSKPKSVEPDAVFAGWYLNPQCTGERYDLSEHNMPANNIALYAKWVNRSYTVTTYTDESLETLYAYDGYTGSQSVVKYEKGVAPTNPTKSGYVFVGWFYKEGDVEKPFSFEMGITKNYDLYPKWSNEVNVNYTIKYVVEGTGDELGTDTGSARIGSSVTVKSKHFEGYFPKTTSTSVQIDQEGQVIMLYYVPATEQTYTVKYVELVNGEPRNIADSVTKTTSDQQVVETAKDIEGFTPDKYQKTLELTAGGGGENVVTFYYTKQVTINYVPLEGGSVTPETETLIRTTGEARGSTATPNPSYKFVGWYDNRACTGNPVSTDAKFVPQQVNGVYEEATYYAKFELDVFDLTITKAGENIDQNQIFVFHVVSDDHKTDMEVTVQGTSSVKIKGLPLGTTYTVTEDTGWTWQYTPDSASKTIKPNGDSTVTFTNTYSKPNWLTSFAEVINKWINGQIKQTEIKN